MSHERPPPASPAGPGAGLQHTGRSGERRAAPARAASLLLCLSPPPDSSTCTFYRTPNDGASLQQLARGWGDSSSPLVQRGDTVVPLYPCSQVPGSATALCPPLWGSLARMGLGVCLPKCVSPGLHVAGAGPAQAVLPGAGGAPPDSPFWCVFFFSLTIIEKMEY